MNKEDDQFAPDVSVDDSAAAAPVSDVVPLAQQSDSAASPVRMPKNNAALAITLAIFIATALVGLGYAAYRASDLPDQRLGTNKQSTEQEKNDNTQTVESAEARQPATSASVDEAIDEVDAVEQELDESEFEEDQLSDDKLGL